VAYKFQYYDKNKDGMLDKIEFRALLKDVFSSQTSTQFLDDAIEETVWRESNVDLLKAKQVCQTG
jgi:Ca2+-binding EF-hand superfamily protein